ncbi:MAG: AMP-binding protein [Proteobacteria bacterium]|nr:AMP-binding protein [Pseudomonadota bacterium]
MQFLRSTQELGELAANIGSLVLANAARRGSAPAFAERNGRNYRCVSWARLGADLGRIAAWLSALPGADDGDGRRVAFIAGNGYVRHVCELAVMASGRVSVPIFAGYPAPLMAELLRFAAVELLVTDQPDKVLALDPACLPARIVLLRRPDSPVPAALAERLLDLSQVLAHPLRRDARSRIETTMHAVPAARGCLIMFTSGTSGLPKGVQLSHANLLSQQQALRLLWKPRPGLRLLSYLPWHHSFGGLFERFFAVASGGCIAVEDGGGKDIARLLENFALVRPHVFFSVPKIYQEIAVRAQADAAVERIVFHRQLQFVFTAAAPLPLSASNVFRQHGIPVVEGWGLTETSPCCTLTPRQLDRTPGVVGFPIPGVELACADDGEILVRGANVMRGYFRNEVATGAAFTADGWFRTGDIGQFGGEGLRILSRKERMFKLANGEKVFPAQIEARIHTRCPFVKYAYVFGSGQRHPHLLVFPSREAFAAGACAGGDDCAHPQGPAQLACCLASCLADINVQQATGYEAIRRALVVGRELSIEDNELTPSFKLVPRRIEERYADCIRAMEDDRYDRLPEGVYVLELEPRR